MTYRAEPEFDQSRDALADLERALGMKELQAAFETSQRAAPSVERLTRFLEEDVALSEQNAAYTKREPQLVREAQRHARDAVPKTREIRDELAKLFPDPRQVLGEKDQKKLDALAQRQRELERKAGDLQRKLSDLAQQAPIFPPPRRASSGSRAATWARPPRSSGRRRTRSAGTASRSWRSTRSRASRRGSRRPRRRGRGRATAPASRTRSRESGGEREGDGSEASREKVKIPGAEAHRVPEEFRRDLLEAMKQGTPERYRGDVQRYYEELVK